MFKVLKLYVYVLEGIARDTWQIFVALIILDVVLRALYAYATRGKHSRKNVRKK